ncbi:hypothetical protein EBF04_25000 [Streptomyces sp. I6]|nr:hypothetical protein EBF04_25000 [Streptomyces sp. I6]
MLTRPPPGQDSVRDIEELEVSLIMLDEYLRSYSKDMTVTMRKKVALGRRIGPVMETGKALLHPNDGYLRSL